MSMGERLFRYPMILRSTFDEVMQVAVEAIHMSYEKAMWRAFIHFKLAAGDQPRGPSAGQFKWRGHILIAVNDHRRRGDFRQFSPEVGFDDGAIAVNDGFQ